MRHVTSWAIQAAAAFACWCGVPAGLWSDDRRPDPSDIPQEVRSHPQGAAGPASGVRIGRVNTVGPTSITIEFDEPYKLLTHDTDESGRLVRYIVDVYPPLPAKELELTPDLRVGRCDERPGFGTYGPADVRVGDRLAVDYSWSRAGVWTCRGISILRRPGGKVPEARVDVSAKFLGYAWHERCQAYQDFEEKGTPIPLKFLPDYEERIAPMPRSPDAAPRPRIVEPRRIPPSRP